MIDVNLSGLRSVAGIGVAGNFAGHLEQAGEAADFANVVPTAAEAPKGIFPWYVPGRDDFLGVFPVTHDLLRLPDEPGVSLQIEPEAGVLARLSYNASGWVTAVAPEAVVAWNDCSIRREGARKISHKKNWGPASKGAAARGFAVHDIDAGGALAPLRIASFMRRDGRAHAYGVDSRARGYSYAGTVLIDWMIDRLRHQEGADRARGPVPGRRRSPGPRADRHRRHPLHGLRREHVPGARRRERRDRLRRARLLPGGRGGRGRRRRGGRPSERLRAAPARGVAVQAT